MITWVDCLSSSRGIGAIVRVNEIKVLSFPKPSIFLCLSGVLEDLDLTTPSASAYEGEVSTCSLRCFKVFVKQSVPERFKPQHSPD